MNKIILYHGTNERLLAKILKYGLKPRGERKSNFDGAMGESRNDLVYLTNCYAPYYAGLSCLKKNDVPVIIKLSIDPDKTKLYLDEEFIFRLIIGEKKNRQQITNKEISKIYKSINPKTAGKKFWNKKEERNIDWRDSLNFMGTVACSYVSRKDLIGVAREKRKLEFVLNCDPSITPINYEICGPRYKKYLDSLKFLSI